MFQRFLQASSRIILYPVGVVLRILLSPFLKHLLKPPCIKFRDDADPDALKILFIGNSLTFTNNLPLVLAKLLSARSEQSTLTGGTGLKIYMVVQGGFTLEDHWKYKVALNVIKDKGPWDYVVLQEQSISLAEKSDNVFLFAESFANEIRATGASLFVFATWSFKDDLEATKTVTELLYELAAQLQAKIVPVGECWTRLRESHRDIELYEDLIHPSQAGTYLAACAFYAVLTGLSPVGLPLQIQTDQGEAQITLEEEHGRVLQETAREVCLSDSN